MAWSTASLGAGGGDKGKMILLNLTPLAIPIVDNGKIKGKITITLKLHLVDPEIEKDVR